MKHILILATCFLLSASLIYPKDYSSCNSCKCTPLPKNNCGNNAPLYTEDYIYGHTFFDNRSQGDNVARKVMGTESMIHKWQSNDFYFMGFVALEFQNGFNTDSIGRWFSTNGKQTMTYGIIDNSSANGTFDLNALQFGVTASGNISFCPKTYDVILDFNLYFGLDNLFKGLWARLDVPATYAARNLNMIEYKTGQGATYYPANLYGAGSVTSAFEPENEPMTQALRSLEGFGNTAWGEVPVLSNGKVLKKQTISSVAGIRLDIGYDWFRREGWHFATSLDMVAPAGSKLEATKVFDAMVSDSKRAQIGATLNFAYKLWDNCCDKYITLYIDSTLNTLLKTSMKRLIGLNPLNSTPKTAVWSQYLVLKDFNNGVQLTGLERAANVLGQDLVIGANFITYSSLMLQFNCEDLFVGLGYEFWLRTKEIISASCLTIPENKYVIKGVTPAVDSSSVTADPYATINSVSASPITINSSNISQFALPSDPASEMYDYARALHPQAYSNKIFGYLGYNWTKAEWKPFLIAGGEVEFGHKNSAITQWGIIGKCGINF